MLITGNILRIGFIGAGSIGSLFGGYLSLVQSEIFNIKVILFGSKEHMEKVNMDGLTIFKENGEKIVKNIKGYQNLKEIEEEINLINQKFFFDYIFITTKTYDLKKVLKEYQKLIDISKWLVILQNGIGNEEIAQLFCPKHKIIRAVTSSGALLQEPGLVIHTGSGITKIGFPFLNSKDVSEKIVKQAKSDITQLSEILNLAGFNTIIVEDIIKECWEKVFINVGINAFGALTRLKNGELLQHEGIKLNMGKAVEEAINVAKTNKIDISDKNYVNLTYGVAEKTSENKNSMLQDILKGNKTEIDFINGRIVQIARKLGINVPINELLTNLIKGLEYSSIESN